MQIVFERCVGLDVHAKTVVACLMIRGHKQVRTFSTMTDDLLQLADWLTENGCSHAAIESTGVYWKPVFNILEASVEVILVNARDVKALPGRKTDVRDCEWLADSAPRFVESQFHTTSIHPRVAGTDALPANLGERADGDSESDSETD